MIVRQNKALVVPIIRSLGFRRVLIGNTVISAVFLFGYSFFQPSTPHAVIFLMLLAAMILSQTRSALPAAGAGFILLCWLDQRSRRWIVPGLVIAVGRKNSEPRIHPGFSIRFGDDEAILSRTLKPVGFYIAYSYTLFRKGDDPRDPLYALF